MEKQTTWAVALAIGAIALLIGYYVGYQQGYQQGGNAMHMMMGGETSGGHMHGGGMMMGGDTGVGGAIEEKDRLSI